jgi:hypothetical protein
MLDIAGYLPEGKETCAILEPERQFTFRKPPNAAWWRKTYSVGIQTAHLCYYLQHKIAHGNVIRQGLRHFVCTTAECVDSLPFSVSTFERARADAVTKGLISYDVHLFGVKDGPIVKQLFFRPTDKFLAPFGVTLNDYDRYGQITALKRGRPKKGKTAPSAKEMSPEDILSSERWEAALDRLPVG